MPIQLILGAKFRYSSFHFPPFTAFLVHIAPPLPFLLTLFLLTSVLPARFGPLKVNGRMGWLQRLTNLMKYNWFHGDIDKNRSELLLRQAKKNSFLVRFSYTSPTQTPFTLSKVTSKGALVLHCLFLYFECFLCGIPSFHFA